jgi:group I intron endonuclease
MISGIYKILNINNGKYYIGSSYNIHKRWQEHKSALKNNRHHSNHLQHAWNKHGGDSFEFLILEELKNEKELIVLIEQRYLDLYKPYNLDIGYNISKTSEGPGGVIRNDLTKRNKENGKIISQYDFNGDLLKTWTSIIEAATFYKVPHSSISRCCSNNRNKNICAGFIWKYGTEKKLTKEELVLSIKRTILQYDLSGNLIKEWYDTKSIQRDLKIHRNRIASVCLGRNKTACGFIWKYNNLTHEI